MSQQTIQLNREEWRTWLAQNHDKTDHVWLLFYKKHANKKGIALEEAVEEAICFGWIDGRLRRIDEEKFALRFSPRKPRSVWSNTNKERAEKLIMTGKMTNAGLVMIEEAKRSGAWEAAYTNKTKHEIPSELENALKENVEAWHNFQNFANSYGNMYIAWVNSAKTEEMRKKRISQVVEQAEQNKKLLSAETSS